MFRDGNIDFIQDFYFLITGIRALASGPRGMTGNPQSIHLAGKWPLLACGPTKSVSQRFADHTSG